MLAWFRASRVGGREQRDTGACLDARLCPGGGIADRLRRHRRRPATARPRVRGWPRIPPGCGDERVGVPVLRGGRHVELLQAPQLRLADGGVAGGRRCPDGGCGGVGQRRPAGGRADGPPRRADGGHGRRGPVEEARRRSGGTPLRGAHPARRRRVRRFRLRAYGHRRGRLAPPGPAAFADTGASGRGRRHGRLAADRGLRYRRLRPLRLGGFWPRHSVGAGLGRGRGGRRPDCPLGKGGDAAARSRVGPTLYRASNRGTDGVVVVGDEKRIGAMQVSGNPVRRKLPISEKTSTRQFVNRGSALALSTQRYFRSGKSTKSMIAFPYVWTYSQSICTKCCVVRRARKPDGTLGGPRKRQWEG